jgi:hypothetical protein
MQAAGSGIHRQALEAAAQERTKFLFKGGRFSAGSKPAGTENPERGVFFLPANKRPGKWNFRYIQWCFLCKLYPSRRIIAMRPLYMERVKGEKRSRIASHFEGVITSHFGGIITSHFEGLLPLSLKACCLSL